MTNKTVDVFLIREIKRGVLPSVSSMASSTSGPIALDADAEVIYGILFSDGNRLIAAFEKDRRTLPRPVNSLSYLVGGILVAIKTRSGDI